MQTSAGQIPFWFHIVRKDLRSSGLDSPNRQAWFGSTSYSPLPAFIANARPLSSSFATASFEVDSV
jgi:hypothetical protein